MTKKEDKEYEQFILDMLFIAVSADDHEDCMYEILSCITDEDEDFDFDDIIYASMFASIYHNPTSFEQDALNDVRLAIALRHLNS